MCSVVGRSTADKRGLTVARWFPKRVFDGAVAREVYERFSERATGSIASVDVEVCISPGTVGL
jgi:hypothetical protein